MFGQKKNTAAATTSQPAASSSSDDSLLITMQQNRINELEAEIQRKDAEIKMYADANPRLREIANELKTVRAQWVMSEESRKALSKEMNGMTAQLNRVVQVMDDMDNTLTNKSADIQTVHKMVQEYKKELLTSNVQGKLDMIAEIINASSSAQEILKQMPDIDIAE